MKELETIKQILESNEVKETMTIRDELGTWFYTGMSNYVCEYGTLGAGFEKYGDEERFLQAKHEIYVRRNVMVEAKANAIEAEADLIEAHEALEKAESETQKLRAQAKLMRAQHRIQGSEDQLKETFRNLKVFYRVAKELEPKIKAKYKNAEEMQEIIYTRMARVRALQNKLRDQKMVTHVPLRPELSAQIAEEMQEPSLGLWQHAIDCDAKLEIKDESNERLLAEVR